MADVQIENATDIANNATSKIPATTEGMMLAYGALFSMAVVSIYVGSMKSVKFHKTQKVSFT